MYIAIDILHVSTVDQLQYLMSVGFGCRKKEILNMPPSSTGPGICILESAGQAHQTVPTASDSPPKRNAFRLTSGRYHPTANTLFRWKSSRRAAARTGGAPLDGRERISRYPNHSPHPATRISKGVLPSSECPSAQPLRVPKAARVPKSARVPNCPSAQSCPSAQLPECPKQQLCFYELPVTLPQPLSSVR